MVADVTTTPMFAVRTPRLRLDGSYDAPYDVARDGRILVLKGNSSELPNAVNVVFDWLPELMARVPTK